VTLQRGDPIERVPASPPPTSDGPQRDGLLTLGRAMLYPGLALTSLLLLRGPLALPIGDILMAGAGFCALLSMRRPPRQVPPMLWLAAALLVVGGAVASAVSSDPVGSLSILARLVYMVVIVPWILLNLLVEQRHVTRAVAWWLIGAAVCGLGAVVQLLFGDVIPGGEVTVDGRFTGITTHQNDLAGISVMAAAAALAAFGNAVTKRFRIFAFGILAVCTTGLILSGSVSGVLGMLAAVVFLLLSRAIHLGRATVVTAAGSVIVVFVLSQLEGLGALNPIERLLRTTGFTTTKAEYDTAGTRMELARRAMDQIRESPIIGNGMLIDDNVLMKRFTVHNNFLGTWTAGGVLAFLGVVIATALAARYCLRRDPRNALHGVVATAFVAALAFAQTAPGIYNRYYWIPVAFMIFLVWQWRPTATPAGALRC
jgi:O-Antigen ligase